MVEIASTKLKGDAIQWYDLYETYHVVPSWGQFKRELLICFGSSEYKDINRQLTKIRQTSRVQEYQSRFEHLSNQTRDWSEIQLSQPLPSPFSSPPPTAAGIAAAPSSFFAPIADHHIPFSSNAALTAASLALSHNHRWALLMLMPLPRPSPALGHRPTVAANRCPAASTTPPVARLPCDSPHQTPLPPSSSLPCN
ncbi:hypothetical protein BHM03_00054550 [Ensete ventricosum]|nr:hypothetical protein BHM03_00054550 [Ensete ventricosum]